MRKLLRVGLLGMLLSGCAQPRHEIPARSDTDFPKLADEFIAGYLDWRPQQGTSAGLHQYEGRVTDVSPTSIKRELARLKEYQQRFAAVQASTLTTDAADDLTILRNAIDREILSFEDMDTFKKNPMVYAGALSVDIYIKRDFAPREERLKSVQRILERAPEIMAHARSNLVPNLPSPHVEIAIEIANGSADFLKRDLTAAVSDISTPEFEAVKQRAIRELTGFADWLRKERLPQAKAPYAIGEALYKKMLACEMVAVDPSELLKIGLLQLRETQRQFAEVARRIDPSRAPIEVFKAIQKDHPTAENLVRDTARSLEAIRQFLVDRKIVTLPSEVRAEVRETPSFLRATSFASMDSPGIFEKKATEAYYYVTPVEPDWPAEQKEEWLTAFNFYTTDVVSIHEAYPGHYTQFLWWRASNPTPVRKLFGSYPFIEGWAHYTEQMMIEQGFGSAAASADKLRPAKYHLAQLDEALLRLCRMCVSLQMHCGSMTVDEATRFFQENAYYEQKPARSEALRGAYDPEYLYYTLGKLQFLKLRDDYRRQEAKDFSLQTFHDECLKHGAPPLVLLRKHLLRDPQLWDKTL